MNKINKLIDNYDLRLNKYTIKGKTILLDTDKGLLALKNKTRSNDSNILSYLDSRSFNYYPKIIYDSDDYVVSEGIKEIDMPIEQKMSDLIDLVSLLHSKTTHYKEVDLDDYQKLYEDIKNNIIYLRSYYEDYLDVAFNHVFMSPSEYLFSRNSTKIFAALYYAENELEKWYKLVHEKRKQRLVVLHNNLELSHFLRDKKPYLISWDKAKIGMPVFDIYKLYYKHGVDYEFLELLKRYERNYPLLEEERKLLFILMAIPEKIDFNSDEYNLSKNISRFIDRIYKTEMIISPYNSKNTKEENYIK